MNLSTTAMTAEEFESLWKEVCNWNRWGQKDELGTLNLITPMKVQNALSLASLGEVVSLSRDLVNVPEADRPEVSLLHVCHPPEDPDCQGEIWTVDYHGCNQTHIDSLAHMVFRGKMFNDNDPGGVPSPRLGVQNMKNGIVTRGILIDIPRLRNIDYLTPGSVISESELDEWLLQANIEIRPGDAVFVRTGRWAHLVENGPGVDFAINWSGLDLSCVRWLKKHDVAVLGSDFANEVSNHNIQKYWLNHAPFHIIAISSIGLPLIDNCDLENLSRIAFERLCWEFMLVVAPVSLPGATGGPVNPLAIF